MSWKDANKPELIKLAEEQGVSPEGTKADIIAALVASGYGETAESEPEPEKVIPKAMIPERLTLNTVYCGSCGTAFRRGEYPGDPCPKCGTPALIVAEEA